MPRSLEEIDAERRALPALYMTQSGKRITASAQRGVFVDEASGEIAWPAYQCDNPACPGRTAGEPHLFIWSDGRFFLDADGALAERQFASEQDWHAALKEDNSHPTPTCPACVPKRNLAGETADERQQYQSWCRPYMLPQTAKRQQQLDIEAQERRQYIAQRTAR